MALAPGWGAFGGRGRKKQAQARMFPMFALAMACRKFPFDRLRTGKASASLGRKASRRSPANGPNVRTHHGDFRRLTWPRGLKASARQRSARQAHPLAEGRGLFMRRNITETRSVGKPGVRRAGSGCGRLRNVRSGAEVEQIGHCPLLALRPGCAHRPSHGV